MLISEMLLRPAVPADADGLAALVQRSYRGDTSRVGWTTEADLLDGQRIDAAEIAAMIADEAGEVIVGETADGVVVACCNIQSRPPVGAYFGMFAVDPALQSGGIGRLMLTGAERRAVELWGAKTVEMTVIEQRTELIEWYVRRGYQLTGERRPFPYGEVSKGLPRRQDLAFVVLTKALP